MAKEKTPVQVMNDIRPVAFDALVKAMSAVYGEDNVFRIGDSEIAVKVADSPDGKPIYARYSPTIANYTERTTKTKTIKAFDAPEEAKKYAESQKNKAEEAAKNAEITAKKKERDAKVRAEKAQKIAEARAAKVGGITRAKKGDDSALSPAGSILAAMISKYNENAQ